MEGAQWLAVTAFVTGVTALSTLSRMRPSSRLARWLRTQIDPGPRNSSSRSFRLQCLLGYTWGDALLRCAYVLLLGGWFWFQYTKKPSPVSMMKFAKALGKLLYLNLLVVLLPVSRSSFLFSLIGISYKKANEFHQFSGTCTVVVALLHGLAMLLAYLGDPERGFWALFYWTPVHGKVHNLAGAVAGACLLTVGLTSFPYIRRLKFELFQFAHFLFIPAVILSCLHVRKASLYVLPGLVLYAMDLVNRARLSLMAPASLIALNPLPGGLTKVVICKPGFRFKPGQHVFVNLPALSFFQWHPFSVATTAEDGLLSLYIKRQGKGSWTDRLGRTAERLAEFGPQELVASHASGRRSLKVGYFSRHPHELDRAVRVLVDGPYGCTPTSHLSYDTTVFVAGGSGASGLVPLLEHLVQHWASNSKRQIVFVWCCRAHDQHSWFLEPLDAAKKSLGDRLNVRLFVTTPMLLEDGVKPHPVGLPVVFARPNFYDILLEVKRSSSSRDVGLLTCGPTSMMDSVDEAAHRLTDHSCWFHSHRQAFSW